MKTLDGNYWTTIQKRELEGMRDEIQRLRLERDLYLEESKKYYEARDKLTSSEIQRSILVEALQTLIPYANQGQVPSENDLENAAQALASQPPNSVAAVLDEVETYLRDIESLADEMFFEGEQGYQSKLTAEKALSKLKRLRGAT